MHTLNHDLLFERFKKTHVLSKKISDGFEETGSPYYGTYFLPDNTDTYNVRLERYTGNYNKPIRLYKLHGSLNYYAYPTRISTSQYALDSYIKLRAKVDSFKLKKEVENNDGVKIYEETPPAYYHPDFLTGTTSKIFRYDEPLLYKSYSSVFKKIYNMPKSSSLLATEGETKR